MGVGFIRRFGFDPGLAVLTAIEGVVIIDREPPLDITGVGAGVVTCVAEFENGPFALPTEVEGSGDLLATFGGFGYTYDGVASQNPCARSRRADGAVNPEYWNGNGFIALVNKRFSKLIITRVDTSVGSVAFTRLASVSGGGDFTFDLEPAQTLQIDVGAGDVAATFNAAAATKQSADGTYPTTFAGGESVTVAVDGTQFVVTFQASDQTHNDVIARINSFLGYTAATAQSLKTTITGRQRGTGGSVQIVAVSGSLVTTATGFTPGLAVAGTGNVVNIDAVTVAEANTIVSATSGLTGVVVDRDANGNVRATNVTGGGAGTIKVDTTSTATAFGFPLGTSASAASGVAGSIPAGTRVQTSNGSIVWVTMQDVPVLAASAGPYSVPVRHALDDGTGASSTSGTAVKVTEAIALGAFAVSNSLPLSAALTESQIDARYAAAIATTQNVSSVAAQTNILFSGRQSNVVRTQLRANADDASNNGCFGRMACIRPPLGTLRSAARSASAQPGVGAYRDQRTVYCFPGVNTFVPQIAALGSAGGAGFTDTGNIDVGWDSWVASLMSNLPPEENIGQATTFLNLINSLEVGNADIQTLTIDDYIAFRAAGICAPRIDGGVAFAQSAVNSVDPSLQPNLKNIARRRMADFIQDSLSLLLMSFDKKLATKQRRALVLSAIGSFMDGLVSASNPSLQRIDSYSLDGITGNTKAAIALGVYRVILRVKTLSSLDSIVLDTEIGETVEITEQAA